MPLDEHVKQGHAKGQMRLKRLPHPMAHLFEVTNDGQHRQDRFDQHARVPGVARTPFQIARVPVFGMKSGVTQHNHDLLNRSNHGLKGGIGHIGRVTVPGHDSPH